MPKRCTKRKLRKLQQANGLSDGNSVRFFFFFFFVYFKIVLQTQLRDGVFAETEAFSHIIIIRHSKRIKCEKSKRKIEKNIYYMASDDI